MFGKGTRSNNAPQCNGNHPGVCAYCPEVVVAYQEAGLRPGSKPHRIAVDIAKAGSRKRK